MLLNLLPAESELRRSFQNLSELSLWAVESRYPGDTPDANRSDAKSALETAKKVVELALRDLNSIGFKHN